MTWFSELYRNAVVKKAIMAVTGLVLFGWLAGHLLGNLKVFQGAEKFNAYAEYLKTMGTPLLPTSGVLWLARGLLAVSIVLHIWSATSLTLTNRRARSTDYENRRGVQLDYAARTMRWSGYLLAFYIVYHLMHLTWGNVHHDFIASNPYANLVSGFQILPIALVYIGANLLLGMHLYHGLWSLFQSLGLNHPSYNAWRRTFAVTFAIVMSLGFISIPVAVLIGVVS
ncbi:MAG: succinate dehydrogenase cytochrome b subunit [Acidobacteriota bacterium]|nr:MAG: succinate dehydrogenase cytochrome b subunit [Acidobacteriota bacterium]